VPPLPADGSKEQDVGSTRSKSRIVKVFYGEGGVGSAALSGHLPPQATRDYGGGDARAHKKRTSSSCVTAGLAGPATRSHDWHTFSARQRTDASEGCSHHRLQPPWCLRGRRNQAHAALAPRILASAGILSIPLGAGRRGLLAGDRSSQRRA